MTINGWLVKKAIRHQNGGTIRAPRLEELKIVEIDPTLYDALVGSYKEDQGDAIATVTREGDRLFGQMTGQPKLELLPKSETEFSLREVDAQVTLLRTQTGR